MVDKAFDKVQEKAEGFMDNVKEGQSEDAPVELPGTHQKRDEESGEVTGQLPGDSGRGDDNPTPGRE